MKLTAFLLNALLLANLGVLAQTPQLIDKAFLASLRTEASRKHPATSAANLRLAAAGGDVRSVHLWDDPMVGLAFEAGNQETRESDGDIHAGFEQDLPKPGLFAAKLTKAEALKRAENEKSRSTSLEIGAEAARAAIELALADESIQLQATQVQWLVTMAANARQMAINPNANAIDALRLESELAREKQILQAARLTRESLAQTLNLRLGIPLESQWPILQLSNAPLPVPIAGAEIARIPRANPKVRSLRELAAAAHADTRITDRNSLPQISLAVESAQYSGGKFSNAIVGFKMSLPAFNRTSYNAQIAASQLREQAAAKDTDAANIEIATAVLAVVAQAKTAHAQAQAYSGEVYERAYQATQAVEGSWINLKSTLTDLLTSNRELLSIRLAQRRFVALQYVAIEDLNLLVPPIH